MSMTEFDFKTTEKDGVENDEWGRAKVSVVDVDHSQPAAPRATVVRYRNDGDQLGRLARMILTADGSNAT